MGAFFSWFPSSPGAAWPQFRGPDRDGRSTETGLLRSWPEEGLEPLWVAEGLGSGFSGVALADGSIYLTSMVGEGDEGVLYALDLSGNIQWRKSYGSEWGGQYPGTRATPTVVGDSIFLLSGVGLLLEDVTVTPPILTPNGDGINDEGAIEAKVFAVEGDKRFCTPGGPNACIVALNPSDGETLWTSRGFSEQSAYCAPIMVERGGTRWLVTITEKSIVALYPDTGEVAWKSPIDPEATLQNHSVSPVYQAGYLYATSGHGVGGQMLELAPDGRSVTRRWTDQVLNTLHGGLVVVDGYVYGANKFGSWICLELKSGNVMYEADGVGMGSVTYAEGMLYCYGQNGTVELVKASPEGYELAGSLTVDHGDGEHWTHPVVAGGRLYIRHGDALIAYSISSVGEG